MSFRTGAKLASLVGVSCLAVLLLPAIVRADVSVSQSSTGVIHVPANSETGSDAGNGGPFPSRISVGSPPVGTVTSAKVTLTGVTHMNPDDMDILLRSPNNTSEIVMSDACGTFDMLGATFTFDDASPSGQEIGNGGPCAQGSYFPSDHGIPADDTTNFAPDVTGPFNHKLSEFNGASPTGDWSLYVYDDETNGGTVTPVGVINSWTLNLSVNPTNTVTVGPLVALPNGTGTISVTVPNAGTVVVDDAIVPNQLAAAAKKKKKKKPQPSIKRVEQAVSPGATTIPIQAIGRANGRIRSGRPTSVTLKVTYTPTGGTAASQNVTGTLKKAKKKKK